MFFAFNSLGYSAKKEYSVKKIITRLLLSMGLCFIVSNAWALPVKYNLLYGLDNYGDVVNGYVMIDEVPSGCISYSILEFSFYNENGRFEGNRGQFNFWNLPPSSNDYISTTDADASFTGNNGSIWTNDATGIWWLDNEGNVLDGLITTYSSLSNYIKFCTASMGYGSDWSFYNGDEGYALLQRQPSQPVPEPSTMILLVSGLLSALFLRKKFMK